MCLWAHLQLFSWHTSFSKLNYNLSKSVFFGSVGKFMPFIFYLWTISQNQKDFAGCTFINSKVLTKYIMAIDFISSLEWGEYYHFVAQMPSQF